MVNQLFPSSGRLKTVYSVQHTPMDINGIGRIVSENDYRYMLSKPSIQSNRVRGQK